MRQTDAVVAGYATHLLAFEARRTLQGLGLDMAGVSMVAPDCTEAAGAAGDTLNWRVAVGALGFPRTSVRRCESTFNRDPARLVARGSRDEVAVLAKLLEETRPLSLSQHSPVLHAS